MTTVTIKFQGLMESGKTRLSNHLWDLLAKEGFSLSRHSGSRLTDAERDEIVINNAIETLNAKGVK
jgi:hypothetical protein